MGFRNHVERESALPRAERVTLLDLLNKSEQGADPNFLRDGVQLLAQG